MTRSERIAALDSKIETTRERYRKREGQLKAKKLLLESAERQKQRKLRTRRLILMGSYMEHLAERDPDARARLRRGLDGFLSADRDRELFELPPRENA